jgi:hypothetical protein
MAYTPEFRASALVTLKINNENFPVSAQQLGVPVSTLYRWKNENETLKKELAIATDEVYDKVEEDFRNDLKALRNNVLTHVGGIYNELKAREGIISLAVLIDKVELLSGNATSRTAVIGNGDTVDEAIERLNREFENRVNSRQIQGVVSSDGGDGESQPTASNGGMVELVSDGGSGIRQDENGSGVAGSPSDPQ